MQKRIQEKLEKAFQPLFLELTNESHHHRGHYHGPKEGEFAESHFNLRMVSEKFKGLKPLARQRLVNEVLQEELQGVVHAFSQKLYSSEEWAVLAPDQR
ncbi:MAG: BolA family protein [Bdellovibrionales bacterium]